MMGGWVQNALETVHRQCSGYNLPQWLGFGGIGLDKDYAIMDVEFFGAGDLELFGGQFEQHLSGFVGCLAHNVAIRDQVAGTIGRHEYKSGIHCPRLDMYAFEGNANLVGDDLAQRRPGIRTDVHMLSDDSDRSIVFNHYSGGTGAACVVPIVIPRESNSVQPCRSAISWCRADAISRPNRWRSCQPRYIP